jgi:hypothetical protein
MKKILTSILLFLFSSTIVNAQVEWKERADFYAVFKNIFDAVESNDFKPILNRHKELQEKASTLWKKLTNNSDYPKELRINCRLLLEQAGYISLCIESSKYNNEFIRGELIVLHNRYCKILLKGEEPSISKELLKQYIKEEKKYLKRKKIIYKENNWH